MEHATATKLSTLASRHQIPHQQFRRPHPLRIVKYKLLEFLVLLFSSRAAFIAENLFLRKQLALFQERNTKRLRTTRFSRISMVTLSRFFDWRNALVIVKPNTFIRWHRTAFRNFWQWKSRKRGRPTLPNNIRVLIREMACQNPTWGEERIANELLLKLGVQNFTPHGAQIHKY